MAHNSYVQSQDATRWDRPITMYEISLNVRVGWTGHSKSNIGTNGSNSLMPRRQMLAGGIETDACSGSILKHEGAESFAEYLEAAGHTLCVACARRNSQRAASLANGPDANLEMEELLKCGLCDVHGFLIPARRAAQNVPERRKRSKSTLVEYALALAVPESFAETTQVHVRSGNDDGAGQMIMKMPARSGVYALSIRYKCAGIGVDTNTWRIHIADAEVRAIRHKCVLRALRDQILSPSGALTASMLPHLTGVSGAIVVRISAGRAPIWSALDSDFVEILGSIAAQMPDDIRMLPFDNVTSFVSQMEYLIADSQPYLPRIGG